MPRTPQYRLIKSMLLGATMLSAVQAAHVLAQDAAPAVTPAPDETVVVVTGYRKSLQDATRAKRTSVNFTDTVFSEDIGKFPDLNLAESLQRVPGVQLIRDPVAGEGTQIAVRGLGPSFTKILLNGSQIAVASDGTTDGGNSNREVDLDLFPSELFTKLEVSKTPTASQLEGGVAGTVNMRNARPFDSKGQHINYGFSEAYGQSSREWSPRGSFIYSNTWDKFGLLVGVAASEGKYRTDGFETVGWTNANLACAGCDNSQGNGFSFATTVPANAGNGLTTGSAVDLAALNPDVSLDQLTNALLPRLARNTYYTGTRKRTSALISLEYRPSESLRFALDMLGGTADRAFDRFDMNWSLRNSNNTVPIGVEVDENNVVTSGTFANAQFFLEAKPYREKLDFYNLNPTMTWFINDHLKLDAQLNYSRSTFFRDAPSFLFSTAANSGVTVTYDNSGGNLPTVNTNVDLGDPSLGWIWYRANVQNVKRLTSTKGAHLDLTYTRDDGQVLKFGYAYDEAYRSIRAFDNSAAYQAAAYAAVPNSDLSQYLTRLNAKDFMGLISGDPGYTSMITANMSALMAATDYAKYDAEAPFSTSSSTATPSGVIDEKNTGSYAEYSAAIPMYGRSLKVDTGLRVVSTDQTITGPGKVNGVTVFTTLKSTYSASLPSFNAVLDVTDHLNLRIAASKTMTRANPNTMLPGLSFSDVSAQIASQGNPNLKPYYSANFDFGGEYYTGGSGYVGVSLFHKQLTGFTINKQIQQHLSDLGIAYADLTAQQQQAITDRGGENVALITVNTQINSASKLDLNGYELTWVQPLDHFVKGLGYTANYTNIAQSSDDASVLATGISRYSYNMTGYYENKGLSIHASYNYRAANIVASAPQNNVMLPLIADARGQWDLSASYDLSLLGHSGQVTLDAINITNEPIRTAFGYDNATYTLYNPGYQFLLGWRGKF